MSKSSFAIKIPMLSLGKTSNKKVKEPTEDDMHKSSVHAEAKNSMRRWIAGEISTKQHKETMARAEKAVKAGPIKLGDK